jgi:hypothetical protein
MTASRSTSVILVQRSISGSVRPQPAHNAVRASNVQIFTQGLAIGIGVALR